MRDGLFNSPKAFYFLLNKSLSFLISVGSYLEYFLQLNMLKYCFLVERKQTDYQTGRVRTYSLS